ncbi:MAG: hypothetical protein K2K80_04830, partial [Clostridia bacterium]|nr:hypothetical protein [Clostridia bacterium]
SIPIVSSALFPIFLKREIANEKIAKEEKSVKIDKKFFTVFLSLMIFLNLIGVLIIALPDFVTEYLEFNYIATICVWWIPIIFDDVVFCLMCTKATYDDEKMIIKKLFRKPKVYYYSDIISFSKTGNLKVTTTKGNFTLFNAFAGTGSLREFIAVKRENFN